ncbi:MAG: hypothetical protein WC043_10340 [Pseudobdellovibrionaceae bacterium]
MIGARNLNTKFITALKNSWDEAAIWPGCKKDYRATISHPSFGQCLVGTLAAWEAHGGTEKRFTLCPGTAFGPLLPPEGVWHFRLKKDTGRKLPLVMDLTWDQFENRAIFIPALTASEPELYTKILRSSLIEDESLPTRLDVIFTNLARHGIHIAATAQETIEKAQIAHDITP